MESKQADFGSKRSFLRLSAAAATLAGLRIVTEPMLAQAARRHFAVVSRKDGIFIDSNENPLGPSTAAREAVAGITPEGGRYRDDLSEELIKLFAEQQGLKTDSIRLFAGSTEPLHYTVLAYTSPKLSYVTADPGFEAGIYMSKISGARVVAVPLTKSYAHDVRAMVSAAPDAGVIYICNPNNPTGTLFGFEELEKILRDRAQAQGCGGAGRRGIPAFFGCSVGARLSKGRQGCDRAAHVFQALWHGGASLWLGHCPPRSARAVG